MKPVVRLQLLTQHLAIPHLLEVDTGVVERHGDRVVPGGRIGWGVDRHLRRLLQGYGVHVAVLKRPADLYQLPVFERLDQDPSQSRIASDSSVAG
jgi:hypothetical protein